MKAIRNLLAGPHRREVLLGAGGLILLVAVLALRGSGAQGDDPYRSIGAAANRVPTTGSTATDSPLAARPPRSPASIRDPFCPLAGPGGEPAPACPAVVPAPGSRPVGLDDVFGEGDSPRARMHVGPVVFPNLREGDAFAGFSVVSLSGRCGEFVIQGDPFTLCEGESVFR